LAYLHGDSDVRSQSTAVSGDRSAETPNATFSEVCLGYMFWERSVKSWIGRPLSSPSYKFTSSPPSAFPIIFHIGNANLKFNSIKSHYIYFILHSYTRHIINYVSLVVILTQHHAFDLTVDIIVQRSHSQTKTQYFRRYEQSRASVTLVPPCASFQTPKVRKCLRTQTIPDRLCASAICERRQP
jgi:hypothetical protein